VTDALEQAGGLGPGSDGAPTTGVGRWATAAQVLAVVVLAVVLQWPRARERDFWFSDASRHALDGVFVVDLVREGGWRAPHAYGQRYFARYPALGVVYYPPFFALVEAAVYAVVGPGVGAARATVVAFGVAAGLGCYALGRAMVGPGFGLMAACCFLTMRDSVYWARDAMLEMPMAAMMVLAAWFFYLWVERERRWAVCAAAAALVAAVLTRQTAGVLVPVFAGYVVLRGKWRLLKRPEALASLAFVVVVLGCYGVFQVRYYGSQVNSSLVGEGVLAKVGSLRRWAYFARHLPRGTSLPLAVLAVPGLVAALRRRAWGIMGLCALWLVMGYVMLTYVGIRTPRYAFPFLPSVAFLAVFGVWALVPRRAWGLPTRAVVCVALLAFQLWWASGVHVPWVSDGYRQAAALVVAEPKGETVLFHGYHAGNFVYHVRVADRERRAIVLRSDKLFGRVRRLGHAEERFEPMVATDEEVAELLTAHGVGYVVIEPNGHSAASAVEPLLRDAVSRPPWRLSAEVPVASHLSKPGEGEILVYENPEAGRATAEAIPFWVPLSERTLRVTYEALRRDRQGSGRP